MGRVAKRIGGQLRHGKSIQDVAEAAGVSIATVSRVLNNPGLVSSKTSERVRGVIAELGYSPNPFAQGLITRESRVLGFALPDIHGEFYSGLLLGADAKARELGYHLLISAEVRTDVPAPGRRALGFGFVDGLALMITEPNATIWREARALDLPVVLMDTETSEPDVDCILVDNDPGTREATEHLLQGTSPDRLFFVGGPQMNFDTTRRANVFRDVLLAKGHEPRHDQMAYGDYSIQWGHRWAKQNLGWLPNAAILAGNDEIAFGILQVAQEAGVSLPGQLRLVGFDDTRLASLVRPTMSSVRVPVVEVGAAAIAALASRVENPEKPQTIVRLATKLVVRESSAV